MQAWSGRSQHTRACFVWQKTSQECITNYTNMRHHVPPAPLADGDSTSISRPHHRAPVNNMHMKCTCVYESGCMAAMMYGGNVHCTRHAAIIMVIGRIRHTAYIHCQVLRAAPLQKSRHAAACHMAPHARSFYTQFTCYGRVMTAYILGGHGSLEFQHPTHGGPAPRVGQRHANTVIALRARPTSRDSCQCTLQCAAP